MEYPTSFSPLCFWNLSEGMAIVSGSNTGSGIFLRVTFANFNNLLGGWTIDRKQEHKATNVGKIALQRHAGQFTS